MGNRDNTEETMAHVKKLIEDRKKEILSLYDSVTLFIAGDQTDMKNIPEDAVFMNTPWKEYKAYLTSYSRPKQPFIEKTDCLLMEDDFFKKACERTEEEEPDLSPASRYSQYANVFPKGTYICDGASPVLGRLFTGLLQDDCEERVGIVFGPGTTLAVFPLSQTRFAFFPFNTLNMSVEERKDFYRSLDELQRHVNDTLVLPADKVTDKCFIYEVGVERERERERFRDDDIVKKEPEEMEMEMEMEKPEEPGLEFFIDPVIEIEEEEEEDRE